MTQGNWLREPDNDLTVIFIHGFNSSDEAWRNPNGTYWPELLKAENNYSSIGIYVFSYRTSISSGYYSIGDVVDSLKEYLRLDKVLNNSQVIFVCHSMGGIVARRFLVTQQLDLLKQGLKEVGLFLVASPSLGSDYANMLSIVSKVVGQTQVEALRFSQSNTWLNDLDKDFIHLKETGKLKIKGKELIEDLPIFLKGSLFLKKQIVEPFSGAKYFDDPYKVANSDHFTIARPEDAKAIQHLLLCGFIKTVKGEKRASNTNKFRVASLESELKELKAQKIKGPVPEDGLKKIKIVVQVNDITTIDADVVALKFAQALYGADEVVASALGKSESDIEQLLPTAGQYKLFFANGRIKAKQVLFFSVVDLYLFDYGEILKFSTDILKTVAHIAPQTKHLAMTIHGVGYGLDEAEALRSQLAGYFDAFDSNNYPPALEQITIVERRQDRVQRLESILREAIPENTVVLQKLTATQESSSQTITRSPSMRNAGRQSSTKPYVLIAIPLEDMEDIYYYGIQSPINKAGYLCERLDLSLLTNDVIERIKLRIETASLVIAELTNPNPNILLEVGYAWGKDCPTLILTQNKENLTFGVDGQRCIFYNRIRDLEENLTKELQLLNP